MRRKAGLFSGTFTATFSGSMRRNAAINPVLAALTLSPLSVSAGSGYTGMITSNTVGSTITATSSDGTTLTVSGTNVSGTFAAAGSPVISLVETLAGATGSPKTSTATITVSAAGVSHRTDTTLTTADNAILKTDRG